jgi:hypothetical protein
LDVSSTTASDGLAALDDTRQLARRVHLVVLEREVRRLNAARARVERESRLPRLLPEGLQLERRPLGERQVVGDLDDRHARRLRLAEQVEGAERPRRTRVVWHANRPGVGPRTDAELHASQRARSGPAPGVAGALVYRRRRG